jgi:hypothetical protein
MAGRGSADRAADLSGPIRPVPVARLVEPAREYEAGRGQWHGPVPAVHSPNPRAPSLGWWSGRRGAGRSWRPGFAKGMFLPAEATRAEPIIGIRGNSAGHRGR